MSRNLLVVCFALVTTYARGCIQSPGSETWPIRSIHVAAPFTKDTYSVEELLVNPQGFAHTLVAVKGCFYGGSEEESLMECDRPSGDIWVEDAESVEGMKELRLFLRHRGMLDELRDLEDFDQEELLFAYDERRNSRVWHRLLKEWGTAEKPVVLLGQFETSDDRKGRRFLHSGARPNALILVDLLTYQPTKRSRSR